MLKTCMIRKEKTDRGEIVETLLVTSSGNNEKNSNVKQYEMPRKKSRELKGRTRQEPCSKADTPPPPGGCLGSRDSSSSCMLMIGLVTH